MKKRICRLLALVCTLALTLTLLAPAFAQEDSGADAAPQAETSGVSGLEQFQLIPGSDCQWKIVDGVLTVKGTRMPDWELFSNEIPWYDYTQNITEISFEGITHIGQYAFGWCPQIKSVAIPSTVESIGEGAFSRCLEMTAFTVDEKNSSYCAVDGIIYSKDKTTLFLAPQGIEKEVVIPEGVTKIVKNAFLTCSRMSSVTLPASLETIDYGAFWGCSALQEISIPAKVTDLSNYQFASCDALKTVNIHAGIAKLDASAFSACNNLTEIKIDAGNATYCDIDGIVYTKDKTTLIYAPTGISKAVQIPEGVIKIADNAFSGCSKMPGITFPNSLESIGSLAFSQCNALQEVTIPVKVTELTGGQFANCANLKKVTLTAGLAKLNGFAFGGCDSLTSIHVEESNSQYCSKELGAVEAVFSKDENALVVVPSGLEGNVDIPSGVTAVGDYAFYGGQITGVTLPDTVKELGYSVFNICRQLKTVKLPEGLQVLPWDTFNTCDSLSNVTVPASVIEIQSGAFFWCGRNEGVNLTVTFQGDEPQIAATAFSSAILSVNYPANREWPTAGKSTTFGNALALTWVKGADSNAPQYYKVTYHPPYGIQQMESIKSGETLTVPEIETMWGHIGWSTKEGGAVEYKPGDKITVTANIDLYPAKDSGTGDKPDDNDKPGDDDKPSDNNSGSNTGTNTPIISPTLRPTQPGQTQTPGTQSVYKPTTPATIENLAKDNWTPVTTASGAVTYKHTEADGTPSTGVRYIETSDGAGVRYIFNNDGTVVSGKNTAAAGFGITVTDDGGVLLNGNLYYLNPDRKESDPRTCYVMTDYLRIRPNYAGQTYYDKDGITFTGWMKNANGGLRYQTRISDNYYLIVWRVQDLPEWPHPDYPNDPAHNMPAGRYFFDDEGILVQKEGWNDGKDGKEYYTKDSGMVTQERTKQ